MHLERLEFEKLVVLALDDLPPYFQEKISNVEVLVKEWPSRRELRDAGVPPGHTLLGLYSGIPLTERTHNYNLVPPDTITLYQGPIENSADDITEIPEIVRHTVIHEFAHHFGISDDRLRELGAY
jgi:predicted Zn-dependent protease with MMP-like domain